jgi:hypothetical protein
MTQERLFLIIVLGHDLRNGIKILPFEAFDDLVFTVAIIRLKVFLILPAHNLEVPLCHELSVVRVPYAADFLKFYSSR